MSKSQIHGIVYNKLDSTRLPRLDKTSDPERDSEPNELVAEAFREGLCLSSYPLLAKCCFLLV